VQHLRRLYALVRPGPPEARRLHALVKTDPEQAWPRVLAFVREHPELAVSQDLIEDFVYEHDLQFIARLEAAAFADRIVGSLVEQAYVGGMATEGVEQFHLLQERLRRRHHT
jgi:hypothetical protein